MNARFVELNFNRFAVFTFILAFTIKMNPRIKVKEDIVIENITHRYECLKNNHIFLKFSFTSSIS